MSSETNFPLPPEDQALLAQDQLGVEAKKFRDSDIGRYLQGVAAQDEEEAKRRLLGINVWQYSNLADLQNAVASIQNKVNSFRTLTQYLLEAISEGEQAAFQLNPPGDD